MRFAWFLPALVLAASAEGADARKFAVPKTADEWRGRADILRGDLRAILDEGRRVEKSPAEAKVVKVETRGEYKIEHLLIRPGTDRETKAVRVRAIGRFADGTAPGLLYLADGPDVAFGPGVDGRPPATELALRGFHVIVVETPAASGPLASDASFPDRVRADLDALDVLLADPELHDHRVGAVGVGRGGARLLWLMGLRPEVECGVGIGGITRFDDLPGSEKKVAAPWLKRFWKLGDTELLAALCAPRKLEMYVRDLDRGSPSRGIDTINSAATRVYQLVGGRGNFHFSRLGGELRAYGQLQWDGGLEILDRQFFPQGPTPLPHPPEPEPTIDERWINPAEFGIAGWRAEMSHRPDTWTWKDGVISCRPGPFEYGWLRCPIPVDDFMLSVEWKIPAKGNAGIFVRARAVPWDFPPSDANKRKVSALGLDWPSRTGLELQCSDDNGEANKHTTGSLYRHAAPSENPSRPIGEWNRTTVRCRGERVELWINGKQVIDTTLDKYPTTLRVVPLRGYFGLQNHGAPADFRNVRYLPLTASAAAN